MTPDLTRLAERLEASADALAGVSAVAGFDAFVDENIRVVEERHSEESYTPVATIADFAEWAARSAGRSGSREFVFAREAGGCTYNMGDGLATLGVPLHAFAGVGDPPHPVFGEFLGKCASIDALGMEPGRALAYEFEDGKLMFCAFNHFARFTPDHLRAQTADGAFRAACERAGGIALTSWSVYPHMTECWRCLYDEILSGIGRRPHFFFDLADPASRNPAELVAMVDSIGGFERIGRATLSLNGNEANQLARALGLPEADDTPEAVEAQAAAIRGRADIGEVSIHLVGGATTVTSGDAVTVEGPYCAKPRRSVGAGDRFNAGFFAGLLLDFEPAERLALGCASSGFFVREARSATLAELARFLREWHAGRLEESENT